MFERWNTKYFSGRLPHYRIIISNKFGGGGLCRKKRREIYLGEQFVGSGSQKIYFKTTLLHEMGHAATRGGHGKAWMAEMLRLAKMGAPTKSEYLDYQKLCIRPSDVLGQFYQVGLEYPDAEWKTVRRNIGNSYGLCDDKGNAESESAGKFLRRGFGKFVAGKRAGT